MTTDADLTEQIAQKLHEVDPISGHDPRWDRLLKMDREWYRIKAAAVLPIVDAAVKRGQAEAWERGHVCGFSDAQDSARHIIHEPHNPHREEQNR